MNTDIINIIDVLYVIYFMLPAYMANISGLVFGGGRPLDMGITLRDGRRLMGDGVTWRGTAAGTLIGLLVGLIQGLLSGSVITGAITGLLLGFGALMGDAAGSFIKRRLKIDRGRPAPILDQLDFVAGALILVSPLRVLPVDYIILIMLITLVLHLSANIIAYLIGMKDVWY
ncbi:CDP-2,3-bis-(O-geranylgeranyl)-sn-glycerol synthase [Methanothermobacter sp.]|uniref:CDP-2,3-bis-(O-geranylgeranyl)-sn-glycerol synthase n=1 Tax=Methanothermobacter sp. TaxID=1884223 RepID=UPI00261C37C8|nr:CDP-2,3-bis-(O-geranylgeranyl)-sn-glycerol synthase [Methanothermobacter sp.]MDI9614240.1 CDP-2,3-bis-(O-geranylgeranyl)-sn-glycerol synthase [Methanothermobacter sp.]